MGNKTALIIGATGLVGRELTEALLSSDDYSKIKILTRKSTSLDDYRIEETIVDFEKLVDFKDLIKADDVYCCIGTTMKKAGSEQEFIKIDYKYPIELAKHAIAAGGLGKYLVVTAVGANPGSSIFYNQVKGELERDLQELDIPALHIFRPSLLLGERKEFRFWESVGKMFSAFLSFFLIGSEKKLWAIQSRQVAVAMHKAAQEEGQGVFFYEPAKIRALAKE